MKKIIRFIFRQLGYEIIKNAAGLPSSQVLFPNFSSLASAYEHLIQQTEGINLSKNASRTAILARLCGTPPAEAYFIINALFQTHDVNGDVCEFGVAQGETSALIANEILASDKKFHLFDSFQGLSNPTLEDTLKDDIFSLGQMEAYKGTMSCQKSWVVSRLRSVSFPLDRYTIHEGFIDDVLNTSINLPQKVAFAYVDFDLYKPIKSTLEFLHTRTEPGAIIIVDDYDFFSTGVKKAVDEFVWAHPQFQIQIPHNDFGHFAILKKTNL
jgi:hypothetical protein